MYLDVSSIVGPDGTSSISYYVFIFKHIYIYICVHTCIIYTCGGFTAWSTFALGGDQ